MRHESCTTCLSWIPSEAVTGLNKFVFGSGFTHYDPPPPDHIEDLAALEALRHADRYRFANRLSAWIEVDDGVVVDAGYSGGGFMGSTTLAVGARHMTFAAVGFPDLQHPVELGGTSARFVQTVGGHTAVPAPRHLPRPPFVAYRAPIVWSTLSLTLHADGNVERELVGASPFPRHWVYDHDGVLRAKGGLTDFKDWWRHSVGRHTPWGDEDTAVLVTEVETALERQLSVRIMTRDRESRPAIRRLASGDVLVEQGAPGTEVFLLLDGVLSVDVDGEVIAEVGPGAVLGERALFEGRRSSTLRAVTRVKVAAVTGEQLDRGSLEQLRVEHGGDTIV